MENVYKNKIHIYLPSSLLLLCEGCSFTEIFFKRPHINTELENSIWYESYGWMYIQKCVLFVQYTDSYFQHILFFSVKMRQGKFSFQFVFDFSSKWLRNHPTGIKWPNFLNMQSWFLIFKKILDKKRQHHLGSWILIGARRPLHIFLFSQEPELAPRNPTTQNVIMFNVLWQVFFNI